MTFNTEKWICWICRKYEMTTFNGIFFLEILEEIFKKEEGRRKKIFRSKQSLPVPINRNLLTQTSIEIAEAQQRQHLSTRGRKRKKQSSNINANQSSILSVPQYSTFIMPSTSNNLKEIEVDIRVFYSFMKLILKF